MSTAAHRRPISLSHAEIIAVAEWHSRQAEYYEGLINKAGDTSTAQTERWTTEAQRRRRRAATLYRYAEGMVS